MESSRVKQFENIRKDKRDKGMSIRALATKYSVHRRTVRQALEGALPPERKKAPDKIAPKLGQYHEIIQSWIRDDYDPANKVPKKQRHTAARVHARLVNEYQADVSSSAVRKYVAKIRETFAANVNDATIIQVHEPGGKAEVDFGVFDALIANKQVRVHLFAMRLSNSGKAFHKAFLYERQTSFIQGHVEAFEYFGGVPAQISYDNLKSAVTQVLKGRSRVETDRFVALRSHYMFESFFCMPGLDGAHEKGGIDGEIGRFRRNHLVPLPNVATMDELNEIIARCDRSDDARVIAGKKISLGIAFENEARYLSPLAPEEFDCRVYSYRQVDTKSCFHLNSCSYSVPVAYISKRLRVGESGTHLVVFNPDGKVVHVHEVGQGGDCHLDLAHFLPTLIRKPGALSGSLCLAQARAQGVFTKTHEAFWKLATRLEGNQAGTRILIDVLLRTSMFPAAAVITSLKAACKLGSVSVEAIVLSARLGSTPPKDCHVDLTDSPPDIRTSLPDLAIYDELLEVAR